MSPLTIFIGRFVGLALLMMCVALAARPRSAIEAMNSMIESPGLMLVTGIVTMAAGAAWVVGHDVWSGGALPIAITALGWLTMVKGFVLIAVPPRSLAAFYKAAHYPKRFRLMILAGAAFGAWLTIAAFTA